MDIACHLHNKNFTVALYTFFIIFIPCDRGGVLNNGILIALTDIFVAFVVQHDLVGKIMFDLLKAIYAKICVFKILAHIFEFIFLETIIK